MRTFSKAYGLAGPRVAHGIAGDPALIDLLDRKGEGGLLVPRTKNSHGKFNG
jgi:hypothetical protein